MSAGLQPQDQGTNNTNQNGHVAAAAHVADGSELPTDFSLPLTTSGAPQSFLGRPLNSLTPEDVQHDRILQDNLVKESNAVLGTGGVRFANLHSFALCLSLFKSPPVQRRHKTVKTTHPTLSCKTYKLLFNTELY